MMRGWIIVAVVAGCSAQAVLAQDGMGYNSRQQAPQGRNRQAAPRYYTDAQLRQAAATQASAPRSPRESAQQVNKRSSGGSQSIMSRFKLPNLLPQSMRGGSDEQRKSQPPMPYDNADAQPQQRQTRNAPQRNAASRPQVPPQSQSQSSPVARSAQPARPAQTSAAAPTSRVARSSPPVSHRRNELAEALSGLANSNNENQSADSHSHAATDSAEPLAAAEEEELPSYLREPKSVATSPTNRPQATVPQVDLRDALLGEVDAAPAVRPAQPPRAAAKSQMADAADVPSIGEDLSDPPMPSPSAASRPSPRTVTTKNKSTKSSATKTASPKPTPSAEAGVEEALGGIEAKKPNAAFADAPTRPTASKTKSVRPSVTTKAVAASTGLLFTSSQPIIVSNIQGPQRIVVGRDAEYRVTVENKGDVAAREIMASIATPPGAEVVDAVASNGTVDRGGSQPGAGPSEIKWSLYELPAGASQTLTIQLIPRSGREMQLGVQLTHAPVMGQATVEIQEPKLQMEIAGPSDVLFGKSQRYALTLTNPGNGAAEDVSIELLPPGGGRESLIRHKVGTLAAGETKKIELELTARESGELKIQASALAAGDLRTDSVKTVTCRKAELQVDWRGPDKKYAGAVATYYFRVRNPGTAPAEQVAVQLSLPTGAELVQASEGHEWDEDRRTLVWNGAGLNAGEERFMQLQCRMTQAGVNKLELSAQTASGDLSDTKSVPVTVEALADLKLEVVDPKGVVPVGEMAVYEIHIKNRGMTAARGVNVVAMFSEGIDPSHVEGGQHSIRDGRVTFRPIDNLSAGSELVLKIHAKAAKSGTHIFRAEVACDELEAKLAAEETTRFFNEEERWADASTAYADEASGTTTR